MRIFLLLIFLLLPALSQALPGGDPFKKQQEFLHVDQAFTLTSDRIESGETQLHWRIADGYYLYKKRISFDGLIAEISRYYLKARLTMMSFSESKKFIATVSSC